ncbi:MAG: NCS2 family permease [Sedimentisphaerales bacterium]|nr:NCS2 family permease [Sedimentisphaerales bacterium]
MTEEYQELSQKRPALKTEIVAGVTTFLTMAYIIFVNPSILSLDGIAPPGIAVMNKQALVGATCIAAGVATLIVGIVARAPIAMAPGMGLNAFFASLLLSGRMNWQTALGAVFLSGLFFLVLTLLGLRKRLVEAIPPSLISAIAVGIGLFITFMGLVKLGIVVGDEFTLVKAGPLNGTILIGLFGLLVMIVFEMLKTSGGLVAGILAATALAAAFGKVEMPEKYFAMDLNLQAVAFKLDILGAFKWGFVGSIFTLMFIDLFDSIGTLVGCCHQANMVDDKGRIRGLDRLLGIDAVATMIGAVLGTSTTTAYIESAAGIEQGGRTGVTSIVTGLLFLTAVLFVPLVGVVPAYATAPALIMVGLFMMREVKKIDFGNLQEAFPAFVIMVMIALSYSISTGLAFGFISFTVIKIVSGRFREIRGAMWVIALLSVLFLALDQLPGAIDYLKDALGFEIHKAPLFEGGIE